MNNMNFFPKKYIICNIIVIFFNCTHTYAQAYTVRSIVNNAWKQSY